MIKLIKYSSLCLAIATLAVPTLRAGQLNQNISLPVTANLTVGETGCSNSPGPQVTVEGTIQLGNVCAKVTLSNNAKGTHTTTVVKEYSLALLINNPITIPKQPVLGGVGGNPLIYLQLTNGAGVPLSDEILLGRCVQGFNLSKDVVTQALVNLLAEATACSNSGGPFITLSGNMVLTSGLKAKLIFRNNVKGTHTAEASTSVSLIASSSSITIPKQPSNGGVGGNPIVTIQLVNCQTGAPLGAPVVLGRCNQL